MLVTFLKDFSPNEELTFCASAKRSVSEKWLKNVPQRFGWRVATPPPTPPPRIKVNGLMRHQPGIRWSSPCPYSLSPLSTPVSRVNPNNCHCRQSASATVSATVFSRRPKSQRIDSQVLQLEAGDGTWSWNCHSAADGACWPSNVRAKHLD